MKKNGSARTIRKTLQNFAKRSLAGDKNQMCMITANKVYQASLLEDNPTPDKQQLIRQSGISREGNK